ncbi:hypothetical protein CDL15_Pgr028166 [Punica granatum]|uniref:Uncharacterized protein n=1 Tax=Punica granatum TaxID=22663 RepID=A0A218XGX2_PUNGR|nr:hypothetical protein CDL15_Pgr028166 [Punica granatum]
MERMGPEVRDWDEENDDMEFEQSTQPCLEEKRSQNTSDQVKKATTAPPVRQPLVRPPPVKPPPIRPHHTPITAHTMEAASSGTAARQKKTTPFPLYKATTKRRQTSLHAYDTRHFLAFRARPCCSSSSTPQVSGEGGKDIQLDGHLDLVPDDPSVSFLESEGDLDHNRSSETDVDETLKMEMPLAVPYGSGTRAGLFRTPISCGVQSATSAHGLPQPALAVRNLMEQVKTIMSLMLHRREGYPSGPLVDFAADAMECESLKTL